MDGRPASPDAPTGTPPPADAPATLAAVALSGRALRYAEADRAGRTLHRLGACDFDFPVDEAVFGLTGPGPLDTVAEAVRNVFQGTAARTLLVAVHPPTLPGFFTPLPEALSAPRRYEQLRQEAALLADVSTAQPVRIRAVPVRAETIAVGGEAEAYRWHHVLHVPEVVHARLLLLAEAFGARTYDVVDATRAATAVVRALDGGEALLDLTDELPEDEGAVTLALGAYPAHAELAVVRGGQWMYGHHGASGAPEDAAYFAAALLDRLGLSLANVDRFFVYGEDVEPDRYGLLADLLGLPAVPLDPLAVFGRTPAGVSRAALSAYVPCLGTVLR